MIAINTTIHGWDIAVETLAEMTDESKVYLYVGDGSDGGVMNYYYYYNTTDEAFKRTGIYVDGIHPNKKCYEKFYVPVIEAVMYGNG